MSEHARFLKGLKLSFLIDVLQNVKRFVLLPVLTKVLGAVNYGVWSQMGTTVDFASTLSNLGLGASMSRFLPGLSRDQLRRDFWLNVLIVALATAVLAAVLAWLAAPIAAAFFGGADNAIFVTMGALLLFLRVVRYHLVLYFRLMLEMGVHSAVMGADAALTLLLVSVIAATRGTVLSIAVASVVLEAALTIWVVVVIARRLGFSRPDFGQLRQYLRIGLPTIPMGASNWALNSLDRFVIAYFLGIGAVGVYSVGYSLAFTAVSAVAGPLWAVIPGRVNAMWNVGDRDAAVQTLRQLLRYWILFATPVACAVVFWGEVIVVRLTRPEFAAALVVIPWVVLAYGMEYTASHYRTILFWTERTRVFLISFPLAVLVNLGLNIYLVPRVGIVGAAYATTAAYAVLLVFDIVMSRRAMAVSFQIRALAAILAIGIGLGWVVSRLFNGTLLGAALGVLIYFTGYAAACYVSGLANLAEIRSGLRTAFAGRATGRSA